ncbi:nuclease-related domain-containing protein [Paraburkholderia sp. UCT31]|uniref:nuclease-related domain-containing protein n=1 Tax=Paraburkholderia sp. UCT31 TaxID=2615209 RepID=UPI001655EBC3|nr:nuclease-related domain-containing protein [Paraburkholderia sp. UCT31]
MIIKELEPFHGGNIFETAGRRAEEQMAFYLRREFANNPKVFVINGLRIEHDGEVAQLDHLVIYPEAFVVVESKSVSTQVRVNELNEWSRLVDGVWRGMPSPIEQAKLQLDVLFNLLRPHNSTLLGRFLLLQKNWGAFQREVVVGISDSGIVERSSASSFPNVLKADLVTGYLAAMIERHARASAYMGFRRKKTDDVVLNNSQDELLRTVAFLQRAHKPLLRSTAPSAPVAMASAPVAPAPSEEPAMESGSDDKGKKRYSCQKCGCEVSLKVARFCWFNKPRFSGLVLCMECQKVG